MLVSYQQQTQRLLNDAAARFFNTDDLTVYINLGRNDVARQTQALLNDATLTTVNGQQTYPLTVLAPPVGSGLLEVLNVRNMRSLSSGLSRRMEGRSWEWFSNYYLDGLNSTIVSPIPTVWAQQTQGVTGNVWVWPTPSAPASLISDATWLPVPLVDDSTIEAIPQPWTDVIPYFAAYLALLQAQRLQDAQSLGGLYSKFIQSSRLGVTPQWLATNWPTLTPLPSNIDVTATLAGQTGKPAQRGEGAL